jgi:hypothetical protein
LGRRLFRCFTGRILFKVRVALRGAGLRVPKNFADNGQTAPLFIIMLAKAWRKS